MEYVNLTPHTLTILLPDGETLELPPSGTVARLEADVQPSEREPWVLEERLGGVVGLPESRRGTRYIVSRIVALAVVALEPERRDVLVPGRLLRDEQGRVVGAEGFHRLVG